MKKQTLASYFNQETKKALNFKVSWNEIISNINYTSERGGYQTTFDRHKISDKHLKKLLLEGFEVNNVHDEDDIIIVSWRGDDE